MFYYVFINCLIYFSSENYSDMLIQTESLCNQNNLLNDELDRLRQLLETTEDSFAASTKETVELREKIKK